MDTKPSSTKSVERLSSPKTEVKRVRFDQRLILSAARGQDFLWIRRKIVDAPEYLGDRTVIRVGERIRVHSYMCSHETDFAGTERRRRRGKNRIGDVRKGKIHALLARRASGGHNSVTAPCASVMRHRSQRSLIRWPRSRRLTSCWSGKARQLRDRAAQPRAARTHRLALVVDHGSGPGRAELARAGQGGAGWRADGIRMGGSVSRSPSSPD